MLSNVRMYERFIEHNMNKLLKLMYCYHAPCIVEIKKQSRSLYLTPLQFLASHVGEESVQEWRSCLQAYHQYTSPAFIYILFHSKWKMNVLTTVVCKVLENIPNSKPIFHTFLHFQFSWYNHRQTSLIISQAGP